ncbi:MAG: nucleotidyltransferase family protein [Bacteroidota bacterium]
MNIASLIPAAGAATRMGRAKQLLPFKNSTIIEHTLGNALEIPFVENRVVLGAYHHIIGPQIKDYPIEITINTDWQKGLGTSIALGMQEMKSEPMAVLVLLADQPLITTDILWNMIQQFTISEKPVMAARYEDILGVPAIFDKSFFPLLASMDGQKGAGKIIKEAGEQVEYIDVPEAGYDIDTPEDYRRLID